MESPKSTVFRTVNNVSWDTEDSIIDDWKSIYDPKINFCSKAAGSAVDAVNDVVIDNSPVSCSPSDTHSVHSYGQGQHRSPLFCSCRLVLSIMSCLALMNMYTLRFNFNVALTWMVKHGTMEMNRSKDELKPPVRIIACSDRAVIAGRRSAMAAETTEAEFNWPEYASRYMVSSFYWGYFVTQIPGGWLAERYGGKLFVGISIFASSIFNLLVPAAARKNFKILIVLRALLGCVQGPTWAATFVLWTRWAPTHEKQKLISLSVAGSFLGMTIVFPAVTFMCGQNCGPKWPFVFYCSGILGIFCTLAWFLLVFDSPEMHPRISKCEKFYICRHRCRTMSLSLKSHPPTPWKSIMTSGPALALIIVVICDGFTSFALLDTFPSYMKTALGFSKEVRGVVNAIPYIGSIIVTVFSGTVYDIVTSKHIFSPNVARKVGNTIGSVFPAIFILAVSFLNCENKLLIVLLIIGCLSMCGFQYGAGYLTNFMDLAPLHIGVFYGVCNSLSTIASSLSPFIVTYIVPDNQMNEWQSWFLLLAGLFLLSGLVYVFFGSAELQKWAVLQIDSSQIRS